METARTSTSATRSLVSQLGAGSGVDMAALAENIAAAQFAARTDRLAMRSEALEASISAASDLKSMMLSLASSLGERIRFGDLSPQPRIANGAVATVALSGPVRPQGAFSLEVLALARSQTIASAPFASAASAAGAGTLTLRFGAADASGFAEDTSRPPVAISIASGATLADVAAAINGARTGVSAYVANTVDGTRLVLKGADGAANGFVLDAAEDPAEPGLGALAWHPASGAGELLAAASDAAFRVDGLDMTAPGNIVTGAIPGLRLTLGATNAGAPTAITFDKPDAAIRSVMQDLTAALNEIAGALRAATDPRSGELANDPGARALRQTFANLASALILPGAAEGAPARLVDLGLATQRDGSFVLDPARLEAALARDADGVAAMFTTGLRGIYATIDSLSRRAGAVGDPGSLGGSIARYDRELRKVSADLTTVAEQQEAMRARLTARFAVSENRIGSAQSTLSFLKNQIAAWNAPRS